MKRQLQTKVISEFINRIILTALLKIINSILQAIWNSAFAGRKKFKKIIFVSLVFFSGAGLNQFRFFEILQVVTFVFTDVT
jgi:hypothetical protein